MRLPKSFAVLSLLLLSSGCSLLPFGKPEERVVVQTKYQSAAIPIQAAPKPLSMNDVTWYVVTEANLDQFIERFKKSQGEAWVFYAMSVNSYEGMAMNIAEIRRYIQQQKSIIIYYEKAISEGNK